jgi:hypothetical protein
MAPSAGFVLVGAAVTVGPKTLYDIRIAASIPTPRTMDVIERVVIKPLRRV